MITEGTDAYVSEHSQMAQKFARELVRLKQVVTSNRDNVEDGAFAFKTFFQVGRFVAQVAAINSNITTPQLGSALIARFGKDWAGEQASIVAVVNTHAPALLTWLVINETIVMAAQTYATAVGHDPGQPDPVGARLDLTAEAELIVLLDAILTEFNT